MEDLQGHVTRLMYFAGGQHNAAVQQGNEKIKSMLLRFKRALKKVVGNTGRITQTLSTPLPESVQVDRRFQVILVACLFVTLAFAVGVLRAGPRRA